MKKLPKLFTCSLDKKIDNSKEYITVKEEFIENTKINKYDLNKKIDTIFKSKNYIYKINVIIKLKDNDINTTIIGRTKDNLITLDNKYIKVTDIYDIKIVD